MGSKADYEARKAQRVAEMREREERWQKAAELDAYIRPKLETIELLKLLDRFVVAAERIAEALEARHE
ncbi:hypothetical protein [Bradyrhizobium sp. 150]|uniref:hypothetical protein n=1 Tax=Bradyrhizobium sp. 150 TaxID=2782625 RepID=UPI001FF9D031|nr:hypothetical protein [Bradyrhizobium sp. 150]MCK1671056.1 hypothetical protein [Bradyrhizobium sp. 150]